VARLRDEQVVEGGPPAGQDLLVGEHGEPRLGGQQAWPAAGGELQPLGGGGALAAGGQRRPPAGLAVQAQPDPVDRERRRGGVRQPLGQQVGIGAGGAGVSVQRLDEADGDVHSKPAFSRLRHPGG
jgi:hypothetical protein